MGILDKVFGRDDDKENTGTRGTSGNTAGSKPGGASASRPGVDRPVADFSDVNASSSSTSAADARTYTVAAGDSLSKIAQREYGDASQWRRIFEANRSTISNPDLIHPGQVLTIPSNR
jgi:nucleoid-associated protein YgaU